MKQIGQELVELLRFKVDSTSNISGSAGTAKSRSAAEYFNFDWSYKYTDKYAQNIAANKIGKIIEKI